MTTSIAGTILGRVPLDTLAEFRWFDGVDAALSVFVALTGLPAIRPVRRITDLQEEHARNRA